jgi:SHS family lactate transporter-like MFS transporter
MVPTKWWQEPTRGQWLCFLAAWSGWVLDAFDFTIFLLVMPEIARDLGVDTVTITSSLTLTLIARLPGGFIAGAAADRWGRKLPLLVSVAWFALCDGAIAIAPSFTAILILRTLFGFGMGGEWASGTTLAMENWPERSRGIASGILQGSWAIGFLLAGLANGIVLPIYGWRALFLLSAAPALLVLPMRWWIPESAVGPRVDRSGASLASLFEPKVLRRIAWGSGAMALGLGAYYALTALYSTLLKTELGASNGTVAWLVIVFNIGFLAGSILWGATAARRGVTLAIALPALVFLPMLPLYVGASPSLIGVGAFLGGALGVGYSGVVPLLLTDLVDANVRARFIGIVYHVGALLASLVPTGIAALAAKDGMSIAVAIMIVAAVCECGLAILIVGRWAFELRERSRTRTRSVFVLSTFVVALLVFSSEAFALDSVPNFGMNPGNLTMLRYVPQNMPANAPLVVALHGCTQTADQFTGSGIDTMADTYKFYVVYPQQQTSNNPVSCFDWFGQYNMPSNKANITRGQGETESIKEMVDKMKADFSVDPSRVFVIGFSAGGAMAAVVLATYPDVFAAGGINSGIPYNCPSTQNADVWQCQNPGKMLAASDWGDRVRAAFSGYSGPYPRVSIWQGTMDFIVAVDNTQELVKQWTNVHGLSQTATSMDMVDGYPHAVYADQSGVVEVESYAITGMDHAYAVDPSNGCGTAGQYLEDKHICTARHMLDFFGITGSTPPPPNDAGMTADSGGTNDAGSSDTGGGHDSGCSDAAGSGGGGGDGGSSDAGGGGGGSHALSDGGPAAHSGSSSGPSSGSGAGSGSKPAPAAGTGLGQSGGGFAGCRAVEARPSRMPISLFAVVLVLALRRRRER